MADKLSDGEDEIRLGLLREIEETNQRIEEQNKKAAVAGAEERKRLEKRIEKEKEKLKILEKQVKPLQEQNKLSEESCVILFRLLCDTTNLLLVLHKLRRLILVLLFLLQMSMLM
jgi:predicted  nucleic acid-binding Zn-ribbon protein